MLPVPPAAGMSTSEASRPPVEGVLGRHPVPVRGAAVRRRSAARPDAPTASRPSSAAPMTGAPSSRRNRALGASGQDAGLDALGEPGVVTVEHAAAQDDLHLLTAHPEAPDDGGDHQRHLVGQEGGGSGRGGVAAGGGVEAYPGELEQPPVLECAGIDRGQYRLGVREPEVHRDELGQGGGPTAPVARSEGEAQGPHPEPRASGGEVAGQLGQGREALDGTVRAEPDAVEAGAAHDSDAPSRPDTGPEDGQRVVANDIGRAPSPVPDGRAQPFLVHRQVDPGQAVHAGGHRRPG